MTFAEEFNAFSHTPNGKAATWATSYPYDGDAARTLAGNSEGQYYSDSSVGADPFALKNGVLSISATPGYNSAGLPYNSGIITTAQSFSQTYGYFEASVKMPAGTGLWPAFWMLPASITYSSELDIFEALGSEPGIIHSTVHGGYADGWGSIMRDITVGDTTNAFHSYGVDWEKDTTTYYMDGKVIGSAPTPDSMNDPMFMILNLAVGGDGSWPGMPNASTAFPATMQIDYVRAYATAGTTYVGGSAATSVATDAASIAVPVTVGTGANSIVLAISEDAWQGHAQFVVTVDGVQQGGVQTASASHAAGAAQQFTVKGDFAAGQQVGVTFLNDGYGGVGADRNMYVDSASFDGSAMGSGGIFLNGSLTFNRPTGPDTLTVKMTQDAWKDDAQARVSIDGRDLGLVHVSALRGAASQELSFHGDFGAGDHTVGVQFVNDAYAGVGADRNLYVQGVSLNGQDYTGGAALYLNSTAEMKI